MGFCEVLTLIFVILKVTGNVNWAWWVVFIPMYPALLLYISIIVLFGIGFILTLLQR